MSWMIALVVGLIGCTGVAAGAAPTQTEMAKKPPYERLLTGEDAKRAEALAKQITELQKADRYAEAVRAAEELRTLRERVQGAEHYEAVTAKWDVVALRKVAALSPEKRAGWRTAMDQEPTQADEERGNAGELEGRRREVLRWRREVLEETHPDNAASYNGVAHNLDAQGKHAEAEPLYRQALAIRRAALGKTHPDTAESYNNVAANLDAQGKCAEAEPLYHETLAICRAALGEADPDTAISYYNLASNLDNQGKHAEAEPLFRQALAIRRTALGEAHPYTAINYNGMAYNLSAQGRYAEAESLSRRALAIRRGTLGEAHPDTAQSYNQLASDLDDQGRHVEAEPLYRQALAICRTVLGEAHPSTATGYNNVAYNLNSQGRYLEAEPLYRRALSIRQAAMGEIHPNTANSYDNLASNLNSQGKYAEALSQVKLAVIVYEQVRLAVASGLDRAAYGAKRSPYRTLASAYIRAGRSADAWAALEADLARGLLDDAAGRRHDALSPEDQSRRNALTARLRAAQSRSLALVTKSEPAPAAAAELARVKAERIAAEAGLAALAAAASRREVASLNAVRSALPSDAALLAWVDVNSSNSMTQDRWACVVRPAGEPIWERLPGTGSDHAWTNADTTLPNRFRQSLASASDDYNTLARRLFAQRLAPLSKHLAGVKRLFVVPAGAMAGVPVEALTDDYAVSYVPSGTFLARYRAAPKPAGSGFFALGDPVFTNPNAPPPTKSPSDLPPGGLLISQVAPEGNGAVARLIAGDVLLTYAGTETNDLAKLKELVTAHEKDAAVPVTVWREGQKTVAVRQLKPGLLGVVFDPDPAPRAVAARRQVDATLVALARGGDWKPLPGTRVELGVAKLFGDKAVVLAGSDASEQRLDDLRRNGGLRRFRYLHFATHAEADDKRAFESALILAQDHLTKVAAKPGEKWFDGKLTANEVLADWRLDADLVTLSACETALGRQGGGDGLLGFAQAFLAVGARAVCLSLWKVDDAATALLMHRFYGNLISRKIGKAAALSEAKRWLRELPADEALRSSAELSGGVARGKGETAIVLRTPAITGEPKQFRPFAHPKYWAAFVLIGDPD